MAYFGITATEAGLRAAAPGEDLEAGLAPPPRRRRAGRADRHPDPRLQVPPRPPRRRPAPLALRASARTRDGWKIRSWPEGLGFADDAGETGPLHRLRLAGQRAAARRACSPPGAPASPVSTTAPPPTGRGWPSSSRCLQRLAPGRPVDLLAHSLGARVALAALPHLAEAPGRIILLGAAEFDARALEFLRRLRARRGRRRSTTSPRGRTTSTTRCSRPSRRGAAGASGRSGSGCAAALPHWLDLQLDRADVTAWINAQGIPLTARERAALPLELLHPRRRARGLPGDPAPPARAGTSPSLRAAPCFAAQEPRWSRLLPRRPAALPGRRARSAATSTSA